MLQLRQDKSKSQEQNTRGPFGSQARSVVFARDYATHIANIGGRHCLLGVDVGEANIAATKSGKVFKANRFRHEQDGLLARRSRLQRNGSQSGKQALPRASGRKVRHVKHINHETFKQIVAEAIASGVSTISMADLTHTRLCIKASKRVRARLHRWPWRQLQDFVAYKAEQAGSAVAFADPAYTSKTWAP